jgi:hypothetical protein
VGGEGAVLAWTEESVAVAIEVTDVSLAVIDDAIAVGVVIDPAVVREMIQVLGIISDVVVVVGLGSGAGAGCAGGSR